jgi:hypothetical protein
MSRQDISPEMQKRLAVNRQGKLTTDQWKELVMEPVVVILLLCLPVLFILGPRMVVMGRGLWLAAILIFVLIIVPALFRAYRYARQPLQCETLVAGEQTPPSWKVWKPPVLHTSSGAVIRFDKKLAPYTMLTRGTSYLVYYLKDGKSHVLLSIIPADHPDADKWQPSADFKTRAGR